MASGSSGSTDSTSRSVTRKQIAEELAEVSAEVNAYNDACNQMVACVLPQPDTVPWPVPLDPAEQLGFSRADLDLLGHLSRADPFQDMPLQSYVSGAHVTRAPVPELEDFYNGVLNAFNLQDDDHADENSRPPPSPNRPLLQRQGSTASVSSSHQGLQTSRDDNETVALEEEPRTPRSPGTDTIALPEWDRRLDQDGVADHLLEIEVDSSGALSRFPTAQSAPRASPSPRELNSGDGAQASADNQLPAQGFVALLTEGDDVEQALLPPNTCGCSAELQSAEDVAWIETVLVDPDEQEVAVRATTATTSSAVPAQPITGNDLNRIDTTMMDPSHHAAASTSATYVDTSMPTRSSPSRRVNAIIDTVMTDAASTPASIASDVMDRVWMQLTSAAVTLDELVDTLETDQPLSQVPVNQNIETVPLRAYMTDPTQQLPLVSPPVYSCEGGPEPDTTACVTCVESTVPEYINSPPGSRSRASPEPPGSPPADTNPSKRQRTDNVADPSNPQVMNPLREKTPEPATETESSDSLASTDPSPEQDASVLAAALPLVDYISSHDAGIGWGNNLPASVRSAVMTRIPVEKLDTAWINMDLPNLTVERDRALERFHVDARVPIWTASSFADPALRKYQRYFPVILVKNRPGHLMYGFDHDLSQTRREAGRYYDWVFLPSLAFIPGFVDRVIAASNGLFVMDGGTQFLQPSTGTVPAHWSRPEFDSVRGQSVVIVANVLTKEFAILPPIPNKILEDKVACFSFADASRSRYRLIVLGHVLNNHDPVAISTYERIQAVHPRRPIDEMVLAVYSSKERNWTHFDTLQYARNAYKAMGGRAGCAVINYGVYMGGLRIRPRPYALRDQKNPAVIYFNVSKSRRQRLIFDFSVLGASQITAPVEPPKVVRAGADKVFAITRTTSGRNSKCDQILVVEVLLNPDGTPTGSYGPVPNGLMPDHLFKRLFRTETHKQSSSQDYEVVSGDRFIAFKPALWDPDVGLYDVMTAAWGVTVFPWAGPDNNRRSRKFELIEGTYELSWETKIR